MRPRRRGFLCRRRAPIPLSPVPVLSPPSPNPDEIGRIRRISRPRPAVAFGGVGSAGPSPLLRGWREFRRSGALVRFLCFEGGAWADVEGEAVVPLRRAFLDGRVVAEAAYGGREFLFDFLRMVRIDAGTAEEVAMGWIDDRGAWFFPVPDSGRKRKRGEPELEDGASSGVEERSYESSDTVEAEAVLLESDEVPAAIS